MGEKIKPYSFPPMLGHIDEVPEGTPEWAERLGLRIKLAVEHAERFGVDELLIEIKRALEAKLPPWEIWPESDPCGKAPRYFEYVSGSSIEKIDALMNASDDDETLKRWRRAITRSRGQPKKESNSDNITITPKRGTSRAYTLDRLERERPDLYERVKARKLTANAAAKLAGWRPTGLDQLRSAWRKASTEERETFRKEIL